MRSGYAELLSGSGFRAFLVTQFLGAFNDNVYKMIVSVAAVALASGSGASGRYLAIAGAVFVLPFLLFAGHAGQLADRFSKTRVLQATKILEIPIMMLAVVALASRSMESMLAILFLLAVQANLFSPAKYAILPEMLGPEHLSRANGLLELSTFAAIVLGSSFGALLFEQTAGSAMKMGWVLVALAVVGALFSSKIAYVRPSGATGIFHWNPYAEVWAGILRLRQHRGLALAVSGITYFWFMGALFQMGLILLGRETFRTGEAMTGLLVTGLAIGIGAGSVAAGRISGENIETGLIPFGAALTGLFTTMLGLTSSYAWGMTWLVATGFSSGLFIVPLNAYLQHTPDARERGRMLATNNFLNMLGVVAASGTLWLLHDSLGWSASRILLVLGVVTVLSAFWMVRLLPFASLRFVLLGGMNLLFRVRVVGGERVPKAGPALIVSNHISFADPVLAGYTTRRVVRFLMWAPYFRIPVLKPFFEVLRAIPLPTGSPKEALRALRSARAELEKGELACIFPEGAITRTGQIMGFERGVERILRDLDAPVIPMYLDNLSGHPLARSGSPSGRGWRLRHPVTIWIGEPVRGVTSAAALRDRILELEAHALRARESSTLPERFVATARRHWRNTAIVDSQGRQLSYGQALTAGLMLAGQLEKQASSENVGVLLPPSAAGAVANLGIALAGRTAVNLNWTAGEKTLRDSIRRCGISTVLTARAFQQKLEIETPGAVFVEDMVSRAGRWQKLKALWRARFAPVPALLPNTDAERTAAILFSSGSTSEPKGVVLSHRNLVSNLDAAARVFRVTERDTMMGALPFFHSFGYAYTLWFPLLRGMKAVFHNNPLDAATIGRLAGEHRATFLLSTPTFCQAYVRKCTAAQFAHLRYVVLGGEKVREKLSANFQEKFGLTPLEGFGCTELGPVVSVNVPDATDARPVQFGTRQGSVGRPLPGTCLRVVDPDTYADVQPGASGLLLVDSLSRMRRYWDDPVRTDAALHNGYFVTGDIVRIDEDGFLFIEDRLARFSKIAGEMIAHGRIEDALSSALDGGAALVVGVADEARGERLHVLYTGGPFPAARLIEHLAARGLPPLWIPRREDFHAVAELPLLGTGKADLRRARSLAQELSRSAAAD